MRNVAPVSHSPDVLIAGAGVIGLSLALELRRQGATVTVVERANALGAASTAAAGMLAAEDPYNPPALLPFARHSLSLYPDFLARIQTLSGHAVPFQTSTTVQYLQGGTTERLRERSIDPRQLAHALLHAVRAASVHILEQSSVLSLQNTSAAIQARTAQNDLLHASHFVHTTGAWMLPSPLMPSLPPHAALVSPRKGQMLRVSIPAEAPLREVHRAEHVYVVPRTLGPQAGTALIGATIEDAGFDISTDPTQLQRLRSAAADLSPHTAFAADAPLVEAWAGLRPSTPDGLPLVGRLQEREWIATGHFRNGILLAPGTADVLASVLNGREPAVDLTPFAPSRFSRNPHAPPGTDIRPALRDNA